MKIKWLGAIVLLCAFMIAAAVWMSGKDKQKQPVDFAKEAGQNLEQPEAVESVQEDGPVEEEVAEVEPVVEESEPIKEIPAEANELLKKTEQAGKDFLYRKSQQLKQLGLAGLISAQEKKRCSLCSASFRQKKLLYTIKYQRTG